MTLPEIKSLYLQKLERLYPETEIDSFFHLLLEHHFQTKKIDLALEPELMRKKWPKEKFIEGLELLLDERPIQYITGIAEFAGLKFKVDENVLIPRPETEELVDWIVETIESKREVRILDIGTGSGCIPITLSLMLPGAEVHALDVSKGALDLAKENARVLGARVRFFRLDVLKAGNLDEEYDLIVSNPPYIRESEKSGMRGNVLKHEPDIALFVEDEDPLLFYRKIAALGRNALADNGLLFFEINENLAGPTLEILEEQSYRNMEVKKDIYGKDRMIRAFKK